MGKVNDLTGRRFGRVIVTGRLKDHDKNTRWTCLCDCGAESTITTCNLRNGHTKSCGCLGLESRKTHGMTGSPEYTVWEGMKARCLNPKAINFKNYGGRGITVCRPWMDFAQFYKDMGTRPAKNYTLERSDNNRGYSHDNCKWMPRTDQNKNRRISTKNTSGVTGVSWSTNAKKYRAEIGQEGKVVILGMFETITDAIAARKVGEREYWGKECQ